MPKLSCGTHHSVSEIADALSDKEFNSLRGIRSGRMATPHAGPGRPKSDAKRCPCGAMTLKRAKARGHKCSLPEPQPTVRRQS
jgi:hypothetical protein